jgi:hypothetical protein
MKNTWLILGILGVGGLAYYVYNKNKNTPKVVDVKEIEKKIKANDEQKFTNAFLTQYDVVVAPKRISEKAKLQAEMLLTDRDEREINRIASFKPSFI